MKIKDYGKTALILDEVKISYSEVIENKNKLSTLIKSAAGERVVIISENRFEYIYSVYAIWQNNSTPVPVDYLSSEEEIRYILNDSQPVSIIYTNTVAEKVENILPGLKHNFTTLNLDKINLTEIPLPVLKEPVYNDEDICVIIYTSGTTGSPKGVMLSYKNIEVIINSVSIDETIYNSSDVMLAFLPFHHSFPFLGTIVIPITVGAAIVFVKSLASEELINAMQKNGVSILIGVPRFYELIARSIKEKINASFAARTLFKIARKKQNLSFSRKIFKKVHAKFGGRIRYMVSGGAAINPAVIEDYYTLGFEMLEGYGMTEAAPILSFNKPGRIRFGSVGFPIRDGEVRIEEDEIVARGPNIMKGYLNKPEETADILKDGWLHTGDLGKIDKDGYIFITGRKKEIIVLSNGKNINPVEIENHFYGKNDNIKELAVFNMGDLLYMVVVSSLPSSENETLLVEMNTLVHQYNQEVSTYKRIAKVILSEEELPKTRLSKIQRYKLSSLLKDDQKTTIEADPEFESYSILKHYLEKLKNMKVTPNMLLDFDLGLDSLDKVNLQVFLNTTFGIDLDSSQLVKFIQVIDLANYIEEKKQKVHHENIDWSIILKEKLDLNLPKSWVTQYLFVKSLKVFFKVYFRLKIDGVENIPDEPCIIAPNHQSFLDAFLVSANMKKKQLSETIYYAKEKHLKQRWLKFLANRHNIVIMDINKDLKASIQKLAAALKKGKKIMIFPEGTRSNDGKVKDFKQTFAILSKEMNVPVVPVAIKGASEAMPKGKLLPRPFKKIHIKFLSPVYPEKHTDKTLLDSVQENVTKSVDEK